MNLFSIAPGLPFLDTLATWWLARSEDPLATADGLFLLPTRRAARGLADAFLRAAGPRPLLLPRIAALGALDEAPLALSGALELPPEVGHAERLAHLTRLVMQLERGFGAPATADRAWPLAAELARLLDEAHREGVTLSDVLPGLVGEDYAQHWQHTLRFLEIVTRHWPDWLRDNGRVDVAARGVALLEAQAAAWSASPPEHPVIVAGMSAGITAAAGLMRVVAGLPQGRVVLPGLDHALDDEVWNALPDSHPQAGLRDLLALMGATRGDVEPWVAPGAEPLAGRVALLRRALLPARALSQWRDCEAPEADGLERLQAADQQEEAAAIALLLREALERPGAQAALVTPDRALAARVSSELARFGVVADDSAGESLAETPPGVFLRLLVQAVAGGLAPVPLLAVLKHPLAALGLDAASCRRRVRRLELHCLRGPAPPPGVAGLRAALAGKEQPGLADLLDRLEARLAPLLRLAAGGDAAPALAMRALIETGEAVAETVSQPGAARLWALEEGEALAQHMAEVVAALPVLPPQPLGCLPGLLDATLAGAVVRSRRALRGRDGAEHPRVAILGLLEARLQSFDVVVLGSLAESAWPPAADPGPWMSRPMRKAAGLPSPEAAVGQMAHDFAQLACAAPRVVLSCPGRRDGAPAVPARWLVRIEAFLRGHRTALPSSPAAAWARLLDQPDGPPRPVSPPRPCPPVEARPRRLSVTAIETWLRDPYGIYAKHVLRLRALDPLDQAADAADYGRLVHDALKAWLDGLPDTYPPDAASRLRAAMDAELLARPLRPALVAWWRPRLHRIADWVAGQERGRRQANYRVVGQEVDGAWKVPGTGLPFELTARADRIDRLPDGTLSLLDYKTGSVPAARDVEAGLAAQLPLEAVMAAAGAFGPDRQGTAAELLYWHLTGGHKPGEAEPLKVGKDGSIKAHVDAAAAGLPRLVDAYDDPAKPYLSQPNPGQKPRFTDYAQLARVAEWSAADEQEDTE